MIDIKLMTEKLGIDDKATLKMLLGEFFNVCSNDIRQLEGTVRSRDFEKIRHHAHSIKGAAKNLWIVECGYAAEVLENIARDNIDDNMDGIYAELRVVFFAAKEEFDKLD